MRNFVPAVIINLILFVSRAVVAAKAPSRSSADPSSIPIHVINLDRDKVRWETVVASLQNEGGVSARQIHRQSAVYGKTLSKVQLRENASLLARMYCTPGMIGCYLSHVEFWRNTLHAEDDAPYRIVLEDDVTVCPNFTNEVCDIIRELDDANVSWDVLLLGAFGCVNPDPKQYGTTLRLQAFFGGGRRRPMLITQRAHVPHRPFGTHAYVLNRRGAKKLMDNASIVNGHVDSVAWSLPELNLLCTHPLLAYQDMSSESTIGGITSGLETRLYSKTAYIDDYTRVTMEWAFNEPVLRIPVIGVILTVGRCISLVLLGYAFGIIFWKQLPWFLPLHTLHFLWQFYFLRLFSRPNRRRQRQLLQKQQKQQPVIDETNEETVLVENGAT